MSAPDLTGDQLGDQIKQEQRRRGRLGTPLADGAGQDPVAGGDELDMAGRRTRTAGHRAPPDNTHDLGASHTESLPAGCDRYADRAGPAPISISNHTVLPPSSRASQPQ